MLKRHLDQIWNQLRAKKPQLSHYLEEVRIQSLHGIGELVVRFPYPVTVLAGPNAAGKSTVLSVLVCAYRAQEKGPARFVPSMMFPDFRSDKAGLPADTPGNTRLTFHYIHDGQRRQMVWSRGRKWNKSFGGERKKEKKGDQPVGQLYFRTLAGLNSPSEVRSVLQLARREISHFEVTADLLVFAHRILEFRYRQLVLLSRGERNLLFAFRDDSTGTAYSEFHMSAGERSILRLSKDLSGLQAALVVIDEIEAGLHPFTQQQLMLELQRLALRQDLQIVVATHSPVVLECVPVEARVFLERSADEVRVVPPWRDTLQRALYGQSLDRLSVLCEDDIGEAIVRGALDHLCPKLNLIPSDIEVGRDAGKDEFVQHVRALAKFARLSDFLFVLDGDGRPTKADVEAEARKLGASATVLVLPGDGPPEAWVWQRLRDRADVLAPKLGVDATALLKLLDTIEQTFAGAADRPANIAKGRLQTLAEQMTREPTELCRVVAFAEAEAKDGGLAKFRSELEDSVRAWRSASL
ncbi:MAG: AAA family ATPase [Myxococcota bacterium]|nr:AAA family ATPase [Myxococcota bacterium]